MEVDKLIRWMQEQEGKREAREVQRQEQLAQFFGTLVTKMMAPGSTEATVARMFAVQPKLLKMTTEDDPEAFLVTFERMAEAAAWPKELWALKLAPCLSGEAQAAYRALDTADAQDYQKVKTAILQRLGITEESYRLRFRGYTIPLGTKPRVAAQTLRHFCKRWLKTESRNVEQITDCLVVEQLLQVIPAGVAAWVRRNQPQSLEEAVCLAEAYQDAEAAAAPSEGSSGKRTNTSPKDIQKKVNPKEGNRKPPLWVPRLAPRWVTEKTSPPEEFWRDKPRTSPGPIICFRCGEPGHIARQCQQEEIERMEVGVARSIAYGHAGPVSADPFVIPVRVEGQETIALIDSGSTETLVSRDLVPGSKYKKGQADINLLCVHGDIKTYPTVIINIEIGGKSFKVKVGVIPAPPFPVILGKNCERFHQLLKAGTTLVGERGGPLHSTSNFEGENMDEGLFPFREEVIKPPQGERKTRSQKKREGRKFLEKTKNLGRIGESPINLPSLQAVESEDNEDFLNRAIELDRPVFKQAQLEDPNLRYAFEQAMEASEEYWKICDTKPTPHFLLNNGLLYRVIRGTLQGEHTHQLLVPHSQRNTIMRLAHTHLLGGHLGTDKTRDRILLRFFWPGVWREVADFCESCPECQKVASKKPPRAPLIPLPIIEVPFDRVGIDIVGPLPKTKSGCEYILVLVDYASRYPEVVPLRNMATKTIARELMNIFCRVGLPKEVLTDQGTPFMSRVFKELCRLLKVKTIRTSVYHPQTDGLVERFNRTLKGMLKRVAQEDLCNWDTALPFLMFAFREVPQASTGFSPFELLFGRQPRGLLDVLREAWEAEPARGDSVAEYVTQLRDRLGKMSQLVQEHLRKEQSQQERQYNQGARAREFKEGDRVLVLVPSDPHKFVAKWQGPVEIVEKVGPVNYKVHQPGKRKTHQIYHVNLLKPWKERECLFFRNAELEGEDETQGEPKVPQRHSICKGEHLNNQQQKELNKLLADNSDVFSEEPGITHLGQHQITTEPGVKVCQRHTRVPAAKRVTMKEEDYAEAKGEGM
ncbi:uncharacterized protein LOC131699088 isoform X1 [Acipenser ruthenus]|uniref:uncharacterized protein LOC131699088 isoform X1 n=1 Tax=Acipenser ruthenus TaxID=7906 RepID=UPI0027409321|nr:uncharacterized protein LOC131699088 isoform X1 [Acipenser ruthenus]